MTKKSDTLGERKMMHRFIKDYIIALLASIVFYELFFVITFGRMPPVKVFIMLCIPTGLVLVVYKRHLLPTIHSDKEMAVYVLCLIASMVMLFVIFKGILESFEWPSPWETLISNSIFNSVATYSIVVLAMGFFIPLGYLLFNPIRVLSKPAQLYEEEPCDCASLEEDAKSLTKEFLQFLGAIDDD